MLIYYRFFKEYILRLKIRHWVWT